MFLIIARKTSRNEIGKMIIFIALSLSVHRGWFQDPCGTKITHVEVPSKELTEFASNLHISSLTLIIHSYL
jgi:hypothetical protein